MNAVEFTTELSGSPTLALPSDIAARLPKSGRARVIVLTDDELRDDVWQRGAYQQFLRDDVAGDEDYQKLR
jgi:hypothetical protein